jgi:hypothetical protein
MGLTFHDNISMVEAAGSLHFAPGHESSILAISQETRSVTLMSDDVIDIKLNDDMSDMNPSRGKIIQMNLS